MLKKTAFSIVFIFCAILSSAQNAGDTTSILADTINIHGRVIDQDRNPIAGAQVLALAFSMHSRYANGYRRTWTDNNGFFTLKGIKPIDTILTYTNSGKEIVINNGSRYLIITVRKHEVIEYKSQTVVITSKRKNNEPKIKLNLVYSGDWHEHEGLYSEPEYPGGVGKFWSFIKNNIKYPDIAVEKNIEGVVSLEFTIDRTGYVKNVEIIRDIGYGCGQEASKVLKSSKRWHMALQNGRPIERRISIEIPFKLID